MIALGLYLLFARFKLVDTAARALPRPHRVATPLVIVMVSAALQTTDPAIELAARSLGAASGDAVARHTAVVRAAIGSGAAFAFLISFDEVVIAIFVAGPRFHDASQAHVGERSVSRSIPRSRPLHRCSRSSPWWCS